MKSWYLLPALVLLAACSAQDSQPVGETTAETEPGPYSLDNLATTDACYQEDRSLLLDDGQMLFERGGDGIAHMAYNLDGERQQLSIVFHSAPREIGQRLNRAGAVFYRQAGEIYDPTRDTVIYHRNREGRFCTAVRDDTIGREFVETFRGIYEDYIAMQAADTVPAEEPVAEDASTETDTAEQDGQQ